MSNEKRIIRDDTDKLFWQVIDGEIPSMTADVLYHSRIKGYKKYAVLQGGNPLGFEICTYEDGTGEKSAFYKIDSPMKLEEFTQRVEEIRKSLFSEIIGMVVTHALPDAEIASGSTEIPLTEPYPNLAGYTPQDAPASDAPRLTYTTSVTVVQWLNDKDSLKNGDFEISKLLKLGYVRVQFAIADGAIVTVMELRRHYAESPLRALVKQVA